MPPEMKCDFCSVGTPAWEYPCRDFVVDTSSGSEGGWMACDACAELIERDQWTALATRSLKDNPTFNTAVALLGFDTALAECKRLHRMFIKNRTGERIPYGRGGNDAA